MFFLGISSKSDDDLSKRVHETNSDDRPMKVKSLLEQMWQIYIILKL